MSILSYIKEFRKIVTVYVIIWVFFEGLSSFAGLSEVFTEPVGKALGTIAAILISFLILMNIKYIEYRLNQDGFN